MAILDFETKTITQSALILSFSTLLSRFLGILRDWLLAGRFGAGGALDIYFTAFKIPDFVYNILIAGGVIVAFLPIFSEYYTKILDAIHEEGSVFLSLRKIASVILPGLTPPSDPAPSCELIPHLPGGFKWLIHLILQGEDFDPVNPVRETVWELPYMVELTNTGQRLEKTPQHAFPGKLFQTGSDTNLFLKELLRRFTVDVIFSQFPTWAAAYGNLTVMFLLLIHTSLDVKGHVDCDWIGHAFPIILRKQYTKRFRMKEDEVITLTSCLLSV